MKSRTVVRVLGPLTLLAVLWVGCTSGTTDVPDESAVDAGGMDDAAIGFLDATVEAVAGASGNSGMAGSSGVADAASEMEDPLPVPDAREALDAGTHMGDAAMDGPSGPRVDTGAQKQDAQEEPDSSAAPTAATCVPPRLNLTRIATAESPMALAQIEGTDRILIAQRSGLVRVLRNGIYESTPFLDLRANVLNQPQSGTHERGLLNFVLHPEFEKNGRFFVFYIRRANDSIGGSLAGAKEGDVVIAAGLLDQNSGNALPTMTALTTVSVPQDHHLGGLLAFGPDGLLYAGIGDGGGGIDASRAGQDPTRRLAKILRINVDAPTMRPQGNLEGDGVDALTWAYGVRNPFRGSFDSVTGDLYFADVGENSWEEVNVVPPGSKNLNFGWGFDPAKTQDGVPVQSGMEGSHPFPFYTSKPWTPFGYLPVYEYPHDGPGWQVFAQSYMSQGAACTSDTCARAVIGGYVYRGTRIAGLYGRYVFGDFVTNQVMSFVLEQGKATCYADLTADLVTPQTRLTGITGFGVDASGELYVMDLAAGNIYRIDSE